LETEKKTQIYEGDVGAMRASGGGLTAAEHGTRTYGVPADQVRTAEQIRNEKNVNGAIADLVLKEQTRSLIRHIKSDMAGDKEIPLWKKPKGINELNLDTLKQLLMQYTGRPNLVIVKGLKDALIKRNVAPDMYFHYGVTRGNVYVDEDDFLYLLSLPNGVGIIMEAVNHEIAHIDNPDLSEAEIERMAPTNNVRKAFLRRAIKNIEGSMKRRDMDTIFDIAISGDKEAYDTVVNMPKDQLTAYFESNLGETIKNLPEDIFGFGKGYDIRGNAQSVEGGVVNLTPANLYLIGKLLGTHYADAGEKALITGFMNCRAARKPRTRSTGRKRFI